MKDAIPKRIGYDLPYLFTKSDIKRVKATYKLLLKNIGSLKHPLLDVGAGESYMRKLLLDNGDYPYSSEKDLDIDKYEFIDDYFQTITSIDVIEHLFNPLYHLLEVKRVLHPDGRLVLITCNDYSLIYKLEHLRSFKYRPHFHQFSEVDLRDIMKRAGFKILSLKKYFRPTSGTVARISRKEFVLVAKKEC